MLSSFSPSTIFLSHFGLRKPEQSQKKKSTHCQLVSISIFQSNKSIYSERSEQRRLFCVDKRIFFEKLLPRPYSHLSLTSLLLLQHLPIYTFNLLLLLLRFVVGVVGIIGYGGAEGEGGDSRGGHSRPGGGTGFTTPPAGRRCWRWRWWKPATASVAAFAMTALRRQGRARCGVDPRRRRQPGALNRREAGPLDLPEPWERMCGFPAYAVAEGGLVVYQATFDSVTAIYLPLMDAAKAGGGGDESLQPELRPGSSGERSAVGYLRRGLERR